MFKLVSKANTLIRRLFTRSGSKRTLSTGFDKPIKPLKPQHKKRSFSLGGPNDPLELVEPNYFRTYSALLAVGVTGSLYYAYHNVAIDTIPVTQRHRLRFIGPRISRALNQLAVESAISKYKEAGALIDDPATNETLKQIQEIGDRVTTANELPKQKYYLVRDEAHNAFVISGHVFVTTGIVPVLKNKDGAAMVLGHEIGHALADHIAERVGLLAVVGGIFLFLKLFGGVMGGDWSYAIARSIVDLPRSRKMESEADYIGLYLMAKACYNVEEAPRVFERMGKATSGAPTNEESEKNSKHNEKKPDPEQNTEKQEEKRGWNTEDMFSTHPTWEKRINLINEWLKEDKLILLASGCQQKSGSKWRIW